MGQVADLRLGDVARVIGRYRPALASVAVIAVVAVALPGGAGAGPGTEPFDPGFAADATVSAPPAAAVSPVVPTPVGGLTAAAPLFEVPAPTSSFVSQPSGAFGGAGGTAAFFTPSPTPTPTTGNGDGGFAFEPQEPVAPPSPLRVIDSLWATLAAGTPLGTAGVPEGGLPVGTRLGETDKASYVRLEGTETTLSLAEAVEGQRQAAGAVVQACAVTDPAWEGGEGASFDDAPAVDESACALGVRDDEGGWTFDLGALGDPAAITGFALLPGPEAPVDFQVSFSAGS